ncbi:MAG: 3-hydroxyacyl-CoA dehydrogenase NAD-binding domain-containing protein, partial [Bacteroidota bacterium]
MKNISVIGSGTMGNGIAHVFAQNGFNVSLIDISESALEKAIATISKNLDRMVQKEKITVADKESTLGNLTTFTSTAEGVKHADLVVEAATENFDIKKKIFEEMDTRAPDTAILATNTSSISITKIAAVTKRPDKVIGMHFMNPVPVMKLIEVIRGYATSDSTTQTIMEMEIDEVLVAR